MFAASALIFTLHAQTGNLLKDFVDKIATSTVTLPLADQATMDELNSNIEPWIPEAPANVLAEALPSIVHVLTKGTAGQRGVVISLLFEVARRQDGSMLLKPYLQDILACLRDPARSTVGYTEYILSWMIPQPIDQVVPYLIDYVNDEKVNEEFRASAIATLVWYASNDPAAISAIVGYMKAKHGKTARATAIQGIGLELPGLHRYSPGLVSLIIDAAKNDSEIRLESVQALGRCGWRAFADVNPILVEIAEDENESGEIRGAAKEALDGILHSPRDQQ